MITSLFVPELLRVVLIHVSIEIWLYRVAGHGIHIYIYIYICISNILSHTTRWFIRENEHKAVGPRYYSEIGR